MKNNRITGRGRWSAILWLVVVWLMMTWGTASAVVTCQSGDNCTQTILLNPGWNAVYLKVKPADDAKETEQVFADFLDGTGPQISSVWTWLAKRANIEYVQNPDSGNMLNQPGWLRFFPADSDESLLTNLFTMTVNWAYLVKLEGTTPAPLVITGKPQVPRGDWKSNTLNLTGFYVDDATPPTYEDFFASSPAHKDQIIYRLDSGSGQWQVVNSSTAMGAALLMQASVIISSLELHHHLASRYSFCTSPSKNENLGIFSDLRWSLTPSISTRHLLI